MSRGLAAPLAMSALLALVAVVTARVVAVGGGTDPTGAACAFPSPAVVVMDEPGVLLQRWTVPRRDVFGTPRLPEAPALRDFRASIQARFDVAPDALLGRQQLEVQGGDAANVRLVLEGEAGRLRPLSCLEALLFETQARRGVARGRTMFDEPTEFLAYMLGRGDTLRVWFYTVDQPGIGGLARIHEPVAADLADGWRLLGNLHNHNFFPHGEVVLGATVPSAGDVGAFRGARATLGLPRAAITNGFHTLEIDASELNRFQGW